MGFLFFAYLFQRRRGLLVRLIVLFSTRRCPRRRLIFFEIKFENKFVVKRFSSSKMFLNIQTKQMRKHYFAMLPVRGCRRLWRWSSSGSWWFRETCHPATKVCFLFVLFDVELLFCVFQWWFLLDSFRDLYFLNVLVFLYLWCGVCLLYNFKR